ncbi:MAG: hypothetical protein AAGF11_11165 [Myxococcota bacterium]
MRILSCSVLALLLLAPACDSADKPKKADDAEAKKKAEEDETAKRIEQRRKDREAKAAAEKKAAEDKQKQIEALCVVPEGVKKPKKLDKACDALAEAQIEFLKRQYADSPDKLAGVEKNAAMQKANIIKMCSSMDLALGLKNAFDNAPMGYGESMNDMIAACIKKLAPVAPAGGGAAVPKKPG